MLNLSTTWGWYLTLVMWTAQKCDLESTKVLYFSWIQFIYIATMYDLT